LTSWSLSQLVFPVFQEPLMVKVFSFEDLISADLAIEPSSSLQGWLRLTLEPFFGLCKLESDKNELN
jgi:hypothetical protein